jgi:hypothetical protein
LLLVFPETLRGRVADAESRRWRWRRRRRRDKGAATDDDDDRGGGASSSRPTCVGVEQSVPPAGRDDF